MTRAPRSASWRVAKGPAIACSSVTTVMPLSGCMSLSLIDVVNESTHHARSTIAAHLAERPLRLLHPPVRTAALVERSVRRSPGLREFHYLILLMHCLQR